MRWIFLALIIANFAEANLVCRDLFSLGKMPNEVFSDLQQLQEKEGNALAYQFDYLRFIEPGGGGTCATVNAANAVQGLRVMAGVELMNPGADVASMYEMFPPIKNGRVTNRQLKAILESFRTEKFNFKVQVSRRFSVKKDLGPRSNFERVWQNIDLDALVVKPGTVTIVIYEIRDKGKLIGRHFVTLKKVSSDGKKLTVLDPANLEKEFTYKIIPVKRTHLRGGTLKLFDKRDLERERTRIIESIVTVTLQDPP